MKRKLSVVWAIILLVLVSCDMKTEPAQKPPSPGEKTSTPIEEATTTTQQYKTGSVIFIHPDGSGASCGLRN